MQLLEEEKKYFQNHLQYSLEGPSFWVEPGLIDIYNWNEANDDRIKVTINFIRRVIVEVARKKGYGIQGNEKFDIDELLKEIIQIDLKDDTVKTKLVGFDASYYKQPQKMKEYFDRLIVDISVRDFSLLKSDFDYANNGFNMFFSNYIPSLIDKIDDICYELTDDKKAYNNVSEKELLDFIKFVNTLPQLIQYMKSGKEMSNYINDLYYKRKLESFYNDEEFAIPFDIIMRHDSTKSSFYFHGTQILEDAKSIVTNGLFMQRNDINSTAFKEFSKDEVLSYETGIGGIIGRDAVVIIDIPKDEKGNDINVAVQNTIENASFAQSGLQGFNGKPEFVIPTEYIVGFIDKKNKKVVFNPMYREIYRFGINPTMSM